MSSLAAGDLQDDISIFEQSSPESLRARALSPHAHNRYISTSDAPTLTDDDFFSLHKPIQECTSSRSSISSFPASVVHHTQFTDNEDVSFRTPSRTQSYDRTSKTASHRYLSAFRNSSSVRALQLESEYADSDTLSLRNSPRPRKSPRASHFTPKSAGSLHSSSTKRSSRSATPLQQHHGSNKLKKEFPLVLLHCTLLPPVVALSGPLGSTDVLEAVLPEEYRKKWRMLQDKVTRNNEVKQRGVLIPHPREDYDLLEEQLLETLELERPRIRRGHYLGKEREASDSGFESSSQNGSDEEQAVGEIQEREPDEKCPDCGKAVSCNVEQDRRWEVKVFAANGLMRSGAWAAAWEEMEKVDVQVGVWMPEDMRAEVEERLKALQAKEEAEKPVDEPVEPRKKSRRTRSTKLRHDERMKEVYGDIGEPKTQVEIDGLADERRGTACLRRNTPATVSQVPNTMDTPTVDQKPRIEHQQQEAFLAFMRRHTHLIWNDQKNLAIVLLSVLVLFFSIQNAKVGGTNTPLADVKSVEVPVSNGVVNCQSSSTSIPVVLYATTSASTASYASAPSFPFVDVEVTVLVEPEEESDGSIIIEALQTPAVVGLQVHASTIENSSAASEVQDNIEDNLIASKPAITGFDASTTRKDDLKVFALALTKLADGKHSRSIMPNDRQEQAQIDCGPIEAAAKDLKLGPQAGDNEHSSEDIPVTNLSSAARDEDPASSNVEIDELETMQNPDFQADGEDDNMPYVARKQGKRSDGLVEDQEQGYFDAEIGGANNE